MKTEKSSQKALGVGILTAFTASLCCITPVLASIGGLGGVAANFSWLGPFRPYMIGLTIFVLAFAWFQKLKTSNDVDCDCEEDKPSFWQSKNFLGLITIVSALLLAFPSYAHVFNPSIENVKITSNNIQNIEVSVSGMTCAGCEGHVNSQLASLEGVLQAKASYDDGNVVVKFDESKTDTKAILSAINETGYKAGEIKYATVINTSEKISFYKVPLVCNAAPTIGCGSRSKPILSDLQRSEAIEKAWLNREGTIIGIEWKKTIAYNEEEKLVTQIFSKHKVSANLLLLSDHQNSLVSFKSGTGWLIGEEVNKLSKEESGIIANKLIKSIEKPLDNKIEKALKEEISSIFYDWFLNYKSVDELGDIEMYRQKLLIVIEVGEKHIGKGNMPDINTLLKACASDTNVESCKKGSKKSSCCSKKS